MSGKPQTKVVLLAGGPSYRVSCKLASFPGCTGNDCLKPV